ncbi:MFS transporter [Qipengyuania sphaerica]|uniref:MFS transporter n=1 Tax=Qipengyuania sphaerica TaxID=2867243 RepID=UPI001C893711|nr:glycoside-pentoside-hexuronide (GPH):cation symporter [Qipengyuania sphaerica]MBX7541821.1 glycoside-pentoside-hexuronide (GPH):cation symporter [Qipengyuania sphaerica]
MAEQHAPVTRAEKLGYGVGELATSFYINFFNIYLLYYFVELGGVAPAAMGLMLLLTKFFDAVTDPVMGAIGDRTRTRWGRYRPYLLWAAVPFGLTGAAIFASTGLTGDAMLVWAYVTYTLTMVAFTAVNVPYSALMGVISPSADVRSSVAAYRMVFNALAVVGVAVVATTLVRELGSGNEARGIMLTMFLLAGAGTISLLVTFAASRERIDPAPSNGRVRDDIALLVRTPAWIAVAVAAILTPIALASRASSALFWFRYVANDDGAVVFGFLDRIGLFYTAFALGQLVGVVFANRMCKRFDKAHLLIAAGAIEVTAILAFHAMPLDAVWPQTFAQLFVGIGLGMMMLLAYTMFTDIAEYLEWSSGRQMTGLAVSGAVFAIKTGVAIGAALPGMLFALTGFEAGEAQSENAKWGIELAFALVPAAIIVPAGLATWFYKLDRKTIATLEADLEARRDLAAKAPFPSPPDAL